MGYIHTHNRPRSWVTDAWPYTEPTEMLQRNGNKSVCTGQVSDEHTQAEGMLLQNKNYRTGRKELEQGT